MSKFKKLLKKHYFLLILFFIEVILFITNYQPGAWLIGWDNLVPELNFSANFKRGFYSLWQEYRGLGLLDGMAHAATLTHTLFLFLLSLVVPKHFLRWLFTFLMHFLGGVGIYFLCRSFHHPRSLKPPRRRNFAFIASLFYLFNFAAIQMFYVPLEVFTVHFAALPWLCLLLFKYLKKANKKNLFYLFIASFLFSTQGFVPTVFSSFFILVILILFYDFIFQKNLKKVVLAFLAILISNSFWLIPFLYSGPANADVIKQAKINQISSRELILRNKEFSDLKNVLLLRSFNLKFLDKSKEGQMMPMMDVWFSHIKRPEVVVISSLFIILLILGISQIVLKKRKKYYPFLAGLLLYFVFLGNDIIIFRPLWSFLEKLSPTLIEAFRIPFTKFSLGFVFCWALILSLGVEKLIELFKKKIIIALVFIILIFCYAQPCFKGYFIYPKLKIRLPDEYLEIISYFKNQESDKRVVVLPQPSFWNWKIYNWGYRGSGFLWHGLAQPLLDRAFDPWSRFNEDYYWQLSYAVYKEDLGLLEKVLEKYNVGYVLFDSSVRSWHDPRELKLDTTLDLIEKSPNLGLVKLTEHLRVYQTKPLKTNNFVYLTKNNLNIGPEFQFAYLDQAFYESGDYETSEDKNFDIYYPFRSLLSSRQSKDKEFEIEVLEKEIIFKNNVAQDFKNYRFSIPNLLTEENFISANLIIRNRENKIEFFIEAVWPEVYLNNNKIFEFKDQKKLGEFFISEQSLPLKIIINGQDELEYSGEEINYPLALFNTINALAISSQSKAFYYFDFDFDDLKAPLLALPVDVKAGDQLKVIIPRTKGAFSYDSLYDLNFFKRQENIPFDISLPNLPQRFSYLINLKHKNLKGEPFFFYVINRTLIKREIETYLDEEEASFILPQLKKDGLGYSLHFDNVPFAREKSKNILSAAVVYPIPYNFLKQIKLTLTPGVIDRLHSGSATSEVVSPRNLGIGDFEVYHPNPSFYRVTFTPEESKATSGVDRGESAPEKFTSGELSSATPEVLVLSQAYHPGWIAYKIKNEKLKIKNWTINIPKLQRLKQHVLVNNWANGWSFDSIVPPSEESLRATSEEELTTYLFFLPQLLEYLGFGLLSIGLIYLLIMKGDV